MSGVDTATRWFIKQLPQTIRGPRSSALNRIQGLVADAFTSTRAKLLTTPTGELQQEILTAALSTNPVKPGLRNALSGFLRDIPQTAAFEDMAKMRALVADHFGPLFTKTVNPTTLSESVKNIKTFVGGTIKTTYGGKAIPLK